MPKPNGSTYIIGVATLVGTGQRVINAWRVNTGNPEVVARYDATDPKQVKAAGEWAVKNGAFWTGWTDTFECRRRVASVAEVVRTFIH
jgi:hypothetical protein